MTTNEIIDYCLSKDGAYLDFYSGGIPDLCQSCEKAICVDIPKAGGLQDYL